MHWLTLLRAGLILNTIGALTLVIGSNKIMDVLSKFVDIVAPMYGTYGQGKVVSEIKNLAQEFNEVKKKVKLINYVGYGFFVAGFILQLF